MANRNSSFGEGQSGAKGAETGIIKPAVERPALQSSGPGARNQPTPLKPKVVEQDGTNIFQDNSVIDEKELAASKGAFIKSGGTVSESQGVSRVITAPSDRKVSSKQALQRLTEHYQVLRTHADTHLGDRSRVDSDVSSSQNPTLPGGTANPKYGKVSPRTSALQNSPEAMAAHDSATKHLSSAGQNLALAQEAFASRNSAKGNGHLQNAAASLLAAHGSLNHKSVREITGTVAPIHKDELTAWKESSSNLPAFRRQGKPFSEVNVAGKRFRPSSPEAGEVAAGAKGTMLGDKVERAKRGTPRTPKWERENPSMPTRSEKGTGVIDTTTRGTAAGTTGEMDPRRKASKTTTIRTTLAKTNLPKIGDTSKKAKKPMKPGDVVEGR